MQQMQVTVPEGVGPGMPFMVNTPAGQMQVTCPPNASAGGQMLVNVPMPAQPAMVAAQPIMAQPMMGQPMMGQPQDAVVMGTVMQTAPQPQGMERGPMDGRVEEIQMGWYTQDGCPCLFFMRQSSNADRTLIMSGPGCFCMCCIGCCPGCCGKWKMKAPGTATYTGDMSEVMTWLSPTQYKMNGGMASGETYSKCC